MRQNIIHKNISTLAILILSFGTVSCTGGAQSSKSLLKKQAQFKQVVEGEKNKKKPKKLSRRKNKDKNEALSELQEEVPVYMEQSKPLVADSTVSKALPKALPTKALPKTLFKALPTKALPKTLFKALPTKALPKTLSKALPQNKSILFNINKMSYEQFEKMAYEKLEESERYLIENNQDFTRLQKAIYINVRLFEKEGIHAEGISDIVDMIYNVVNESQKVVLHGGEKANPLKAISSLYSSEFLSETSNFVISEISTSNSLRKKTTESNSEKTLFFKFEKVKDSIRTSVFEKEAFQGTLTWIVEFSQDHMDVSFAVHNEKGSVKEERVFILKKAKVKKKD